MQGITIYHNPQCGTSRNVLAMIIAAGYEPTVIEYVKTGWNNDDLTNIIAASNLTPKQLLRVKGSPAEELGLIGDDVTDEELFNAMLVHPILVNRPIVCTQKGTALCRPSEKVLELLEQTPKSFTKEDGEIVL